MVRQRFNYGDSRPQYVDYGYTKQQWFAPPGIYSWLPRGGPGYLAAKRGYLKTAILASRGIAPAGPRAARQRWRKLKIALRAARRFKLAGRMRNFRRRYRPQ